MGGHRGGEVASQLALETVESLAKEGTGTLADQVKEANRVVFDRSQSDRAVTGMGTTLTATRIVDGAARLAHVGDSRAYLLRAGAFRQLTEDHTLVNRMVKAGEITADEADVHPHRNVLTRALGTEPDVRRGRGRGRPHGRRPPPAVQRRALRHGHRGPDQGDPRDRARSAAGGRPAGARGQPRGRRRQHHDARARRARRRRGRRRRHRGDPRCPSEPIGTPAGCGRAASGTWGARRRGPPGGPLRGTSLRRRAVVRGRRRTGASPCSRASPPRRWGCISAIRSR